MTHSVLPDPTTPFGERALRRLNSEVVIWLTTVGKDGTPQPNPVWFLLDNDSLLIYNRPDANRIAHIGQRPQVALNLDGDGKGGDIVVVTGTARLIDDVPPCDQLPAYLEKYEALMTRVAGSPEKFGKAYPVAMRIDISKVRGH
ncbi:MAG TPA: TIGR03667 family PPOX class F420-dependent oxidoreductase [Pseudonocardiaceae bacterium]|jgi:PPOX class probable F420-dependent enzyme|nr:TIGR03667 family PPOX class F420-dependent oxidoreductase [Pseudonocardiaceae bacterium]